MEGFVALPEEVKVSITAIVLAVVSFFLAKLIAIVPFLKFLESFREPLALSIAAALIGWVEASTPDAFGNAVVFAIQLGLALLAAFGVLKELRERGVKAFR